MNKTKILTTLILLASINVCAFAQDSSIININNYSYSPQGTVYYNNGLLLMKEHKYTEAINEFRKALRENTEDKSSRIQLVNAYLARAQYYNNKEMDYNKAANDLRSAIFYMKYYNNVPPEAQYAADVNTMERNLDTVLYAINADKTPKGHYTMGKSLRAQRELAAAATEFQKSQTDTTYRKSSLANLGEIYYTLNLNTQAVDYLKEALVLDPKNNNLHMRLAGAYERLGKTELAAEEYNLALTKSGDNSDILMSLESIWKQKVNDFPNDAEAHANLGAVYQKKKDYANALAQYEKAEQLNPSNITTRLNLGTLYQEQKEYETAIEAYDTIIDVNPNYMLAYLYKAQCYRAMGNKDAAMQNYKLALNIDPSNQDVKKELDDLYETGLTPEEKLAYIQSLIQKEPMNTELIYRYAYELHKANRLAEAVPYYNQVIKLSPNTEDAYINLAQVYTQQGNYDQARSLLNDAKGLFPDNIMVKKQLASINAQTTSLLYTNAAKLFNEKKYKEAITLYNKILPATPESLLGIGACYQAEGDNKQAALYYEKSFALDPKNADTAYYAALAYANLENYAKSRAMAKKALTIEPNHKITKELMAYVTEQECTSKTDKAIDHIDKQEYPQALTLLNSVINADPKNADAYYYRGMVYDAQKKYQLAINDYKKALQYNPQMLIANYSIAIDYDYLAQYSNALMYHKKYLELTKKAGETNDYTRYSAKRIQDLKAYESKVQSNAKPVAKK